MHFFKNYFITGGYVAGGVSLSGGSGSTVTGNIAISGAPANVDILAAFLYVQTADTFEGEGIAGAKFRGFPLDSSPSDSELYYSSSDSIAIQLNDGAAPCVPGTSASLSTYRADVLRFLPIDAMTKKHVVNGTHSVEVPDTFYESSYPRPIGASLVVVYRDPTQPLKAIVIYDGAATKEAGDTFTQTIEGFYQAATTSPVVARMTHIVGDGDGLGARVRLNGQLLAAPNPFAGADGPKWDTKTFNLNSALPAGAASAVVTVEDPESDSAGDCLSYSAIVFSTTVQDRDNDGLLDRWESSGTSGTLTDPNGDPLPDLFAMGARPGVKDLFVEISYLKTDVMLEYGSIEKPIHTHLPTAAALNMVGDAFRNAPVSNPNGSTGINVHFDVGNNRQGSPYVIPASLARGGEAIKEFACNAEAPRCQYPDWPGTVGWKTGFRFLKDAFVHEDGTELVPAEAAAFVTACKLPLADCRTRFDHVRKDMFHFALFAHRLALPKSDDPDSSDFNVPRTNTGVGDFPGGDFMVTVSAFDNAAGRPIGTPFQVAGTILHELGHNLELRHGGAPVNLGEGGILFQPNCKPNVQSSMNYLFQLRGLINAAGIAKIDLSAQVITPQLNEIGGINEVGLGTRPYRTSWFAPRDLSIAERLEIPAATKHCDGSALRPGELPGQPGAMVRIDGTSVTGRIDWNADGDTADSGLSQDVNFTGGPQARTQLSGYNEWANIRLNQVGGRRNIGASYLNPSTESEVIGPLSLDVGQGDLGQGDLGQGDLGQGDLGQGDLGQGDLGQGDLGQGDLGQQLDEGRGDLGRGDLGTGDLLLDPATGAQSTIGELDFETATAASGHAPPTNLTATPKRLGIRLRWKAPGNAVKYFVWRFNGSAVTPPALSAKVLVATVYAPTTTVRDSSARSGKTYTYFVVAAYPDGTDADVFEDLSGPSNFATATKGDRDPDDDHDEPDHDDDDEDHDYH